tara:strand:+ start:1086 stop:1973 length:888 start_codon:yes stop_codon:yes gene_type:complete
MSSALKKILIFIIIFIIFFLLLFYILIDKIFIKKIILNIENNLDLNISLLEPHKLNVVPEFSLLTKFNLDTNDQNLILLNGDVYIKKSYINDSIKYTLNSEKIIINKIIIENFVAQGEIYRDALNFFFNTNNNKDLLLNSIIKPKGYLNFNLETEQKNSLNFLNLIITRLKTPEIYKKISNLLVSLLLDKSYFTGNIKIKNNFIDVINIETVKDNFKINFQGKFNFLNRKLNCNIVIKESGKDIVKIDISGDLENPKIKVLSIDNRINMHFFLNDIKTMMSDGVESIIKYLIANE